jgi:transcriptional regulator with XRE-family HTH domain
MEKPADEKFGHTIRARRRRLGLTQRKVAQRINTSTLYMGLLESGARSPSTKILIRLVVALGLNWRETLDLAKSRRL